MIQSVRAFLPAPGDPAELREAFVGDPGRWLPVARHAGPDRWVVLVSGWQIVRPVEVQVGEPWTVGKSCWRSLRWDPTGDAVGDGPAARLLPVLDGEIGLHELGGAATLVFEGRYRPPGGPVGAAADSIALHRVAQTTIEHLLADVTARLCAEGILVAHGTDGD
jgi:hypothetical protein